MRQSVAIGVMAGNRVPTFNLAASDEEPMLFNAFSAKSFGSRGDFNFVWGFHVCVFVDGSSRLDLSRPC